MRCWERPEPVARRIWDLDVRPVAVLPACGMLQVSDGERYLQRTEIAAWIRGRIKVVCESYLPSPSTDPEDIEEAIDALERGEGQDTIRRDH